MSRNAILAIALVAIIAIIGLSLAFRSNSSGTNATSTSATSTVPDTSVPTTPAVTKTAPKVPAGSTITGGNTYTSLLTQKGNYQCDYEQVQSAGQGKNIIYLSDGKMRAEFRNISGNTGAGSMSVYDGRYLYSWSEGSSVGTRTAITSLGQLPAAIPRDLTSGNIYGTNFESVGWTCRTWLVDKSLLAPPTYVKFQ